MKRVSDATKRNRLSYYITFCLSILLTVLPLLIYTFKAFDSGETQEKLVLGVTVFIALALVVINVLFKYNIRSTVFILLLGIYCALDHITDLLLIISICTIVDEFIVHPLCKSYKNKLIINKELDKRG